jgi:hypothetical protein
MGSDGWMIAGDFHKVEGGMAERSLYVGLVQYKKYLVQYSRPVPRLDVMRCVPGIER